MNRHPQMAHGPGSMLRTRIEQEVRHTLPLQGRHSSGEDESMDTALYLVGVTLVLHWCYIGKDIPPCDTPIPILQREKLRLGGFE